MSAPEDQPPPIPNDTKPVWELVMDDMAERHRVGIERYGTPLQVSNGRSMLIDAYQEELDKIVHLRGAIEEANLQLPLKSMKMQEAIQQAHKYLHGDSFESVYKCGQAPCYWLVEATE